MSFCVWATLPFFLWLLHTSHSLNQHHFPTKTISDGESNEHEIFFPQPYSFHSTNSPSIKHGPAQWLSCFFTIDLQFGTFCCIFATAKEAHACFLFLVSGPSPVRQLLKKILFHLEVGCHPAQMSFWLGPDELPSVAVLQCRLGQVGKLISLMRRMGRMR